MKRLLSILPLLLLGCGCLQAATPSFSSFATNNFTTNGFIIRTRLNPANFDTNAASITITNAGGANTTNIFNTIIVTNLYAGDTYTTNLYVTNIVANNITVTTNLYITTNTYVIIDGSTNDVELWISTNSFLRPIASLNGTNEFQIAEATGWTGGGTNAFMDDGTFQSVAVINPTDGAIPYRLNQYGFEDSPWRLWWNGAEWDTNRLFFNTNLWVRDGITITAVGRQAGEAWISGGVTAFGQKAATEATTANGITAIGDSALSEIHTGFGETAVGNSALEKSQGFYDTAIGASALGVAVNSEGNTAAGYQAGLAVTDGQYNTFLGYKADTTLATITNSISIGTAAMVTNSNEIVIGNTNNTLAIFPITSYTGAGTKALTDDGTYKTFAGSSTTINPTDTYIPFRTNATTFLNSPFYVVSTNVATDSQIIFGTGTTNVLYRSGPNLVYTNSSISGPMFTLKNGGGYTANFGMMFGDHAMVLADSGKRIYFGPNNNTSGTYVMLSSEFGPVVDEGVDLGQDGFAWKNLFLGGTNYVYGFGSVADYSRLAISHSGTNGAVVIDSQSSGTAGSPRPIALEFGATNYYEFAPTGITFGPGTTNVLYRNSTDLVYTNGSGTVALFLKQGTGNSGVFSVGPGGSIQLKSESGQTADLGDVAGNMVRVSGNSFVPSNASMASGSSAAPWGNLYSQTNYIEGFRSTTNYSRLATYHTGTNGVISYVSQANGTAGVARPHSFSGADIIIAGRTPASSSETNYVGAMTWDSGYIYVWTETNVNKRATLNTW